MSFREIPTLRIGDLEVKVPILQGGMGVGVSLSGLASAVAEAGGIGIIATAGIALFEPDSSANFKKANKRYYLMILVKLYYVYKHQRLIPARCYAARPSPDVEGR